MKTPKLIAVSEPAEGKWEVLGPESQEPVEPPVIVLDGLSILGELLVGRFLRTPPTQFRTIPRPLGKKARRKLLAKKRKP
jgi:hypothetical protein